MALSLRVFDLPESLSRKADPALVGSDEEHFAAIASALEESVAELTGRLAAQQRTTGRFGQEVLERDLEVHRLAARLRTMRRFDVDLCLGRMVGVDDPGSPVHVGRLGLTAPDGRQLLVDWRSPAAEPFFGATHADPMGLVSRRRYRWSKGRVVDYWDEVFDPSRYDGYDDHAALDDQSAFIVTLGSSRSDRMQDVLGTIQADQDAIIRAGSRGTLVVDGGPGTGKTVVALHRAAYLLYSDPRLGHDRGGLLFVGPHEPYLSYVADVLPRLGEEGVQMCTLRDLVPGGRDVPAEPDAEVARLKGSARVVEAVETGVRFYEEAPTRSLVVSTDWGEVEVSPTDWHEAFATPGPGAPHNESRDQVWDELVTILADKVDAVLEHRVVADGDVEEVDRRDLAVALRQDEDLVEAFDAAWPLVEAEDLVGDLWTVPAYLRHCAPWLSPEDVRRLRRERGDAWTVADLPFLDAARRRLGDPEASRRRRRRAAAAAAQRAQMNDVVEHLLADDDTDMKVMSMLRGEDLRSALDDEDVVGAGDRDPDGLAGPFAHVLVDEAQELTDAEWQMVMARCPSRSLTVVGDRAQARHGFPGSWQERLARIGLDQPALASLSINYRTPQEVMDAAEPVIRAAIPDANVPTSVRSSGVPVTHGSPADLDRIVADWLARHDDGVACVIGHLSYDVPSGARGRVRSLTPETAKGLEFDLVVLVEPDRFGDGIEGAVDRYVAMTRATQRLVILR